MLGRTPQVTCCLGSGNARTVATRSGPKIVPDEAVAEWRGEQLLPSLAAHRPAQALDQTLSAIAQRYGDSTAHVVTMQLEYPK
jgi:hypothetical protein